MRRLANDGATVVFSYVADEKAARDTVAEVQAAGGAAIAVHADVADPVAAERLFQTADSVFTGAGVHGLDICVINAGIGDHAPVAQVTERSYQAVMGVNAYGAFLTLQEAARRIADNGRIVAVSSTSTAWPSPGEAVYAASKAAVEQFTRVASRELGHAGSPSTPSRRARPTPTCSAVAHPRRRTRWSPT